MDKKTMKAVRLHGYGGPEALVYEDAPSPEPGAGQVLVRVKAAGIQPVDWEIRRGDHPEWGYEFPLILGTDVAGVVAEVGEGVEGFRAGQEVWGQGDTTLGGSYAEYCVVPAGSLGVKPRSLGFVEAASAAVAASTARQALYDIGGLEEGQTPVVLGAGGAVGSFAVQLAKAAGARRVLATCSVRDYDRVRSLGADRVLPYDLPTPYEDVFRDADLVYDPLGGGPAEWDKALAVLKGGGICVASDRFPSDEDKARAGEQGKRLAFVAVAVTTGVLDELAGLFDAGKLKPEVGAELPLSEAKRAHEWGESREHARGRIVLRVDG